jgi:tetratricopeptide (TPR) repeat protein
LGCAQIKGNWFLTNERYEEGIRSFEKVILANPDDPAANYYMGRYYLALEKPEQALPYFRKAVQLKRASANYQFWLGVAYWAVMDFKAERESYLRALSLDKKHVPARLYLAHNHLDKGEWQKALTQYEKVIKQDRYNPEALYSRGLALKQLNKPAEEIQAWKSYLKYYPDGRWALRAVDHLNALGDFSYRNFTIGYRRVTLEQIVFAPGTARLLSKGRPSLRVVGSILKINQEIELQVVGYKKDDRALATARAKAVRDYLLRYFPAIEPSRLKYLGEGHEERITTEKRPFRLDESIAFVTTKK